MKAGVLANSAPALLCWSNLVTGTLCTLMIRTRFAGRPTRRTTYIFTGIKNEYQVFISRLVLVLVTDLVWGAREQVRTKWKLTIFFRYCLPVPGSIHSYDSIAALLPSLEMFTCCS